MVSTKIDVVNQLTEQFLKILNVVLGENVEILHTKVLQINFWRVHWVERNSSI